MQRVVLIGRPNVGKSTLFNRLIGRRQSIVERTPGVTRDRLEAVCRWEKASWRLVDTGGFAERSGDPMWPQIRRQLARAVETGQVLVLVCDGREGVHPIDQQLAKELRKAHKPVIVAVNKMDTRDLRHDAAAFFELGFERVVAISAEHGLGCDDLLDAIIAFLGDDEPHPSEPSPSMPAISIVGRPNVGKSSFFNALAGDERVLVSPQPGTTRDTIDSDLMFGSRPIRILDTAGLRRVSKVRQAVDYYAWLRAQESVASADGVLVLIDAVEGMVDESIKVFEWVMERGKPLVWVINKWDLIRGMSPGEYEKVLRQRYPFLDFIPMVFVSSKTGQYVREALQRLLKVLDRLNTLKTGEDMLPVLEAAARRRGWPFGVRIRESSIATVRPLRIRLCGRGLKSITRADQQFWTAQLRRAMKLDGIPVQWVMR